MVILTLCSSGFSTQVYADNQSGIFLGGAYRFSDDGNAHSSPGLEIPDGNSGSLVLWLPHSASTNIEIYSSHFDIGLQGEMTPGNSVSDDAKLRIDHLQLGGIKFVEDSPDAPLSAFVGATLGITRMQLAAAQSDSETRWAYSVVGGFLWRVAPAINLRLDARWLGTVFNHASTLDCDQAQCTLQFDAGSWSQYDVGLSVGVRF